MELRRVLRQERKFLLSAQQRAILESRFSKVLRADENNGSGGYVVRSLYFDTLDDRDFFTKLDGVELRRKIRLRVYSPDAEFAFLEMKQKQGSDQLKRSLRISRNDAEALENGNYAPLRAYPEDFAAECYGLFMTQVYRPKVLVEYLRAAYILPENSIRITFDSRVCASSFSGGLFKGSAGFSPILNPSATVLEVKYDHFQLGYVKNMLQGCDGSETSVSKYALSRQRKICF